jgi:hypothetical protein
VVGCGRVGVHVYIVTYFDCPFDKVHSRCATVSTERMFELSEDQGSRCDRLLHSGDFD